MLWYRLFLRELSLPLKAFLPNYGLYVSMLVTVYVLTIFKPGNVHPACPVVSSQYLHLCVYPRTPTVVHAHTQNCLVPNLAMMYVEITEY